MASIFGVLDKRQRAETDALTAADAEFTFDERADFFNDLLEEDTSIFPLLDTPPEVLAGVLLLSEVSTAVRLRPLCAPMRTAIDSNTGLWCSLTIRDFSDMGGRTKHYRGLRTLADAWDDSRAVARLEWDPLMICAPPPLRYTLLATSQVRRKLWDEHGHSLGAGWAWFSSRVCRRMATSTFIRWASLQHEQGALERLMGPVFPSAQGAEQTAACGGAAEPAADCGEGGATSTAAGAAEEPGGGQHFRCGRSDSVKLSAAAVSDIYETVQRWHNKAHCDMMRAHFGKQDGTTPPAPTGGGSGGAAGTANAAGGDGTTEAPGAAGCFSVTPTLDAAEAAAFAAEAEVAAVVAAVADDAADAPRAAGRGEASRRLEEAQLRLALELSKSEADAQAVPEIASGGKKAATAQAAPPGDAAAAMARDRQVRPEPAGLPLRVEGGGLAPVVFLKPHCLAERVEALPESMEKSIEMMVHKMTRAATWGLLYESVTEELGFRAKSAAHALCAAHFVAMDGLVSEDISLKQERMCLPIWRSSREMVISLSKLRVGGTSQEQRLQRRGLLRQAALEWCELEDLTEFLDSQLAPLELAIDNFRGEQESSKQHTPHVRDIGRLMFRNFCLLDSRVFRPLCLAAYALVHEVQAAKQGSSERRGELVELLESLHSMLVSCDVADDDLSLSKNTKDPFVEHLVEPISAAFEKLSDWDVRGHPSQEDHLPGGRRCRQR